MTKRLNMLSLIALLMISVSLNAHHSVYANFDKDAPQITVNGVLKKLAFVNPHSYVTLEVTTKDGKAEIWKGETWPRNILIRRGWNYKDLKPGDVIELQGFKARRKKNMLWIVKVTRPADGWTVITPASDQGPDK